MNLLISEDVKSLTDLLLSLFFDQIRLFFFYLKSSPHPLWCFEEWNEILLLLPQLDEAVRPYLNPWKASDQLESQLSMICGISFLILSRIHGEKEEERREQWMGLLHQFEKEVLIQQHAKNEGAVLYAIDAVLRAMDGCILSLTKQAAMESNDWVMIEGIRFPRSLLDLIFMLLSMHSNQHPSISTHFAQYLYSPFAQSNATLPFLLDALFALSLSEFPFYFSHSSAICWENEWIQPFRSLSLIEFMSVLIDRINSFSSPIIVLNAHVTEDVLCDEIGDEWMGHFASAPKDETVEVCCYVQDEYGVALKRGFLTGAEAARIDGEVYWRPELPVPPISELPTPPSALVGALPQMWMPPHAPACFSSAVITMGFSAVP